MCWVHMAASYIFGKAGDASHLPQYCVLIIFFQVVEFCTAKTHNREAPNLQNKMCNHRSTWDVISESPDFQNAIPLKGTNPPPHPTFSLLKSQQRVVCLVLDKSGSMSTVRQFFAYSLKLHI